MAQIDDLKIGDIIVFSDGQVVQYQGTEKELGSGKKEMMVNALGISVTFRISTPLSYKKLTTATEVFEEIRSHQQKTRVLIYSAIETM